MAFMFGFLSAVLALWTLHVCFYFCFYISTSPVSHLCFLLSFALLLSSSSLLLPLFSLSPIFSYFLWFFFCPSSHFSSSLSLCYSIPPLFSPLHLSRYQISLICIACTITSLKFWSRSSAKEIFKGFFQRWKYRAKMNVLESVLYSCIRTAVF